MDAAQFLSTEPSPEVTQIHEGDYKDADGFSKIRESFNLLLQRLFQKMEQNHSDEGAITLKVNLSISKDFIPDGNGSSREVHKPILKYKIDTQVPVKDGFDGKNDTGMELVYDDELKRYVLRYVSEGGQQSIFDPEYANVVNGEATIVDEQPALPMNAPLLECSEQDATEADNSSSDSENTSNEEIIDQDDTNGAKCTGMETLCVLNLITTIVALFL